MTPEQPNTPERAAEEFLTNFPFKGSLEQYAKDCFIKGAEWQSQQPSEEQEEFNQDFVDAIKDVVRKESQQPTADIKRVREIDVKEYYEDKPEQPNTPELPTEFFYGLINKEIKNVIMEDKVQQMGDSLISKHLECASAAVTISDGRKQALEKLTKNATQSAIVSAEVAKADLNEIPFYGINADTIDKIINRITFWEQTIKYLNDKL